MKTKLNWKAAVPLIVFNILVYPFVFYFVFVDPPSWFGQGTFWPLAYISVAIWPAGMIYAIIEKLRGK